MRTALHEACRSPAGNEEQLYEIVNLLIQHGAGIDDKSVDVGGVSFLSVCFRAHLCYALAYVLLFVYVNTLGIVAELSDVHGIEISHFVSCCIEVLPLIDVLLMCCVSSNMLYKILVKQKSGVVA